MADLLTLLALLAGLVFVVQSNVSPQELAYTVKGFIQNLFRRDGSSTLEGQNRDESAQIGYLDSGLGRGGYSPVIGNMRGQQLAMKETPMDDVPTSETRRTRDLDPLTPDPNTEYERSRRSEKGEVRRRDEAPNPALQSEALGTVEAGDAKGERNKRKREGSSYDEPDYQDAANGRDERADNPLDSAIDKTSSRNSKRRSKEPRSNRRDRSREREVLSSRGEDEDGESEGGIRRDAADQQSDIDYDLNPRSKLKLKKMTRNKRSAASLNEDGTRDFADEGEPEYDRAPGSTGTTQRPARLEETRSGEAGSGHRARHNDAPAQSRNEGDFDDDGSLPQRGRGTRGPGGNDDGSLLQDPGRDVHPSRQRSDQKEKADQAALAQGTEALRVEEEMRRLIAKQDKEKERIRQLDEAQQRREESDKAPDPPQRDGSISPASEAQSSAAAQSPVKRNDVEPELRLPKQNNSTSPADPTDRAYGSSNSRTQTQPPLSHSDKAPSNTDAEPSKRQAFSGETDHPGMDRWKPYVDDDAATLNEEEIGTSTRSPTRKNGQHSGSKFEESSPPSTTGEGGSESGKPLDSNVSGEGSYKTVSDGDRSASDGGQGDMKTKTSSANRQEPETGPLQSSGKKATKAPATERPATAQVATSDAHSSESVDTHHETDTTTRTADVVPDERKSRKKSEKPAKDIDTDCEQGSSRSSKPVKRFWRNLKQGWRNALKCPKQSIVCLILVIGYVVMTCLGAQYGKAGSFRGSSPGLAKRQSLEDSSSFDTGTVASTVSDAVSSATERIQSADLSLNGFQQNLFAISMAWHFVFQFVIIWLVSDVISPVEEKESGKKESEAAREEEVGEDEKITFKQVIKALPKAIIKDIPLLIYRFIRDSIKKAYRIIRRAKKWTYVRLALLAGLGLVMLLVARQLSSLTHIARDPTAKPWSAWPDVTMLHDTLQASISDLATGERLVTASLCFWFVSITASVYCMSSLADRPAVVPADEEKALGGDDDEIYV